MSGQTGGTGTLVERAPDSTGAMIAGAKVTVVNQETSSVSTTITSVEGGYYVPYLAPAPYRLMVEATGFKQYVRSGIEVRAGEVPRVDVRLDVGALSETVEVTGAAPLLATETSSSGQILAGDELRSGAAAEHDRVHARWRQRERTRYTEFRRHRYAGLQHAGCIRGREGLHERHARRVRPLRRGTMSIVFKSATNQLHGVAEDRYIGKNMIHRSYLEQLEPTNPFSYHEMTGMLSGPVKDRTSLLFGLARHAEIG